MNDHTIQNTVTAVAVAVPSVAFWANINPILTGLLAIAGLCWYSILFSEKVTKWIHKWRNRHKYPKNH